MLKKSIFSYIKDFIIDNDLFVYSKLIIIKINPQFRPLDINNNHE